MNNYYKVVNDFLTIAKQNPFIKSVEYGNIYEQHNSGNIEYNTFTLTQGENSSQTENEITYNFIAFVTDRLLEDKSNLLYVQSSCKTILDTILTTFKERHSGWSIDTETFSFWEEKFNDYCAGCFVNFSVTMPIEFSCAGVAGGGGNTIDITSNGTYDVTNYDTALVNVHSTDVFNYFTLYPSNYIYANYLDLSTEIVANVKFTGDEDFYFCSDEKGLVGLYFDAKENETYAWWDSDRIALHFHKRDWDKGFYKIQFKAGRLQIGYLTWTLDSKSSTTSFDPLYFGYMSEKTSPMEIEYITISNQYGAAYDYRPKITDEYAELVEVISGKIADIRTVYEQEDAINMDSGVSFRGSIWNAVPFNLVGGTNRKSFDAVFAEMYNLTTIDVSNVDFSKADNINYLFMSDQNLREIKGLETLNFANATTVQGIFQTNNNLGSINISKWNIPKAGNISWLFAYSHFDTINVEFSNTSSLSDLGGSFSYLNCENIIGLNSWDTSKIQTLAYIFDHFSIRNAEKKLDLSNWVTPNLQTINCFMQNDPSNEDMPTWVDIHNLDCSKVYDTYAAFEQATKLSTIIGDHSLEEVQNNEIMALKGLQVDIDLSSTNLERPSLLAVIKGVAEGAHTLSLGPLKSRLDETDIQLATDKGWTIN